VLNSSKPRLARTSSTARRQRSVQHLALFTNTPSPTHQHAQPSILTPAQLPRPRPERFGSLLTNTPSPHPSSPKPSHPSSPKPSCRGQNASATSSTARFGSERLSGCGARLLHSAGHRLGISQRWNLTSRAHMVLSSPDGCGCPPSPQVERSEIDPRLCTPRAGASVRTRGFFTRATAVELDWQGRL
jgi:hypothetical protein